MSRLETLINQTNHVKTGESYKVVTTSEVITKMNDLGYVQTSWNTVRPKLQQNEGYQKHLIRFAHSTNLDLKVNQERPEIIIVNSYDGSSALSMFLGFYRLACANGLMVGTGVDGVSIRHVGEVLPKIEQGINDLTRRLPLVAAEVERYKARQLSQVERIEFKRLACATIINESAYIYTDAMPLRAQDTGIDAWTVFNAWQERILRYGIKYTDAETGKIAQTRAIKSVSKQVKVNRELWDVLEQIAS